MEIVEKIRTIEKAVQEKLKLWPYLSKVSVLQDLPAELEQEIERKVERFSKITCILEGWKEVKPESIMFDAIGRVCIDLPKVTISLPFEIFLLNDRPELTLYEDRFWAIDAKIEAGMETIAALKRLNAPEIQIEAMMEELGQYLEIKENLDKVLG